MLSSILRQAALAALVAASAGSASAQFLARVPVRDTVIAETAAAAALVTLSSPSFGDNAVGYSITGTSLLVNGANIPVTFPVPSSASITGTGFSFATTTCTGTLPAGSSCSINIDQTPTSLGTYSGTLSVVTTPGGTKTAALSAKRSPAFKQLTVDPINHAGTVLIGSYKDFLIGAKNTGNIPLNNLYGWSGAPFTRSSSYTTCPATMSPGLRCGYGMRFTPTAVGIVLWNSWLRTDEVSAVPYWADGVGTYAIPGVVLTDVQVSSPKGVSAPVTATLTNSNGTAFAISSIEVQVSAWGGLSSGGTTCGASLNPGQSCTITAVFAPDADMARSYHGAFVVNGTLASWINAESY